VFGGTLNLAQLSTSEFPDGFVQKEASVVAKENLL